MNESLLITRSLNGDNQAFEQLVVAYQHSLMRFLRVRCQCQSDADDIFQETFLNAHKYLSSYDHRFAFSTWLFRIAINLLNQHYHKKESHQLLEEEVPAPASNESHNLWHIAKHHLSRDHFTLLWMCYAEGYTGQELSHLLDRSLPWVKINLIRAKQKLKQALDEYQLSFADLTAR